MSQRLAEFVARCRAASRGEAEPATCVAVLAPLMANLIAGSGALLEPAHRRSDPAHYARNPILITALNAVIGYEAGAAIAKKAYAEGRPLIDVALSDPTVQKKGLKKEDLVKLLNPADLTTGGIKGPGGAGG